MFKITSFSITKPLVLCLIAVQFLISFGFAFATTTPEFATTSSSMDAYETVDVSEDEESFLEEDTNLIDVQSSSSADKQPEVASSDTTSTSSMQDVIQESTSSSSINSITEPSSLNSSTTDLIFSTTSEIVDEDVPEAEMTYKELMSRYNKIAKNRADHESETEFVAGEIQSFILSEKNRLQNLGVSEQRINKYVETLSEKEEWLRDKSSRDPNIIERSIEKAKKFFGLDRQPESIQIPKNLPSFEMTGAEDVLVEEISYSLEDGNKNLLEKFVDGFKSFFVSKADADTASLPVISDIATSTGPATSNLQIRELAQELEHNPVAIFNYLKNNIAYEPYYGALKGADGCLADMVCNDVDLAALAISLYRESGIPARYKKVEAVITPEQMIDLLGTQDVNTALQTLYNSGYFAGITAGEYDSGGTLLNTDLSGVTQVVVEWMIPQVFVQYNELGGNFSHTQSRSAILAATSTDSLRQILSQEDDGQWLDVDVYLTQSRTHTPATEVVPESFDVVAFWEDYLEYSGTQEPYDKFYTDLTSSTSKDIASSTYQTTSIINEEFYSRLPISSLFQEGIVSGSPTRETELFSDLTTVWLPTVEYRLLDRDTEDELFSFEAEAYILDEVSGDIFYKGETSTDEATIESYGGIAQTPATLVAIIPVLTLSDGTYVEGLDDMEIGQKLIFETIFDPKHDDPKIIDKFATAGNEEGFYIAFSKVSDDPVLDNSSDPDQNSKILLKGNSEIVRQYFKRQQEERALFTRAFNVISVPTIQAGVITQTRVLEEDVNGFPTTFEFAGLGLNAFSKVVISDRERTQDQRVGAAYLTGLAYSDYEGQVFNDIAGLNGIATIQGFQYAHASSSYNVYKITPSDRSNLTNLNLSSSTISNMDDALDEGRIVYTPDQIIIDGEWRGIVYITVDPDSGSATYAIGEQVQNGGWTKDGFQEVTVTVGGKQVGRFKNEGSSRTFVFADSIGNGLGSINCSISNTNFSAMLSLSGYQASYGLPCVVGSTEFSDGDERIYAVATDGARLDGTWVSALSAYSAVKSKMDSYPGERYGRKFRFSTAVGTYAHDFCSDYALFYCPDKNEGAVYYNPDDSSAHAILGDSWKKYTQNGSIAARTLGYPTSDIATAASYEISNWPDTDGTYQNFVAGQMIQQTSLNNTNFGTIAYLPDPIAYCHNHPSSCGLSGSGGTGGVFGFPQDDPILGTDGKYYQTFGTGKQIIWNTSNGDVDAEDERKYRCEIYGNQNGFWRKRINISHGLLDSGLNLTSGLYQLVASAVGVVASPIDSTSAAYRTAQEYADKVSAIDLDAAAVLLSGVNDAAANAWLDVKDEYDQSFGSNGCLARQWYLEGYVTGALAETLIPIAKAGKLGNVSKVADLDKASTDAKAALNATESIIKGAPTVKFVASSKLGRGIVSSRPAMVPVLDRWKSLGGDWDPRAHHILLQSFRNSSNPDQAALINALDDIWQAEGYPLFDLDDGAINGVFLPYKLHKGGHSDATYTNVVLNEMENFVSTNPNRAQVIAKISEIREDLITGRGGVYKINSLWDDGDAPEYMDALANTLSAYED